MKMLLVKNQEFMELTKEEKKEMLKKVNVKWKKHIASKLEERNFDYLLSFTEEAKGFMKNIEFKDLYWTENYHYGINASFGMKVDYCNEEHLIKGSWRLYALPEKKGKYIYFDSERADELFARLLHEFGFGELLIQFDGNRWKNEFSCDTESKIIFLKDDKEPIEDEEFEEWEDDETDMPF